MVIFDEPTHTYTSKDGGTFISATTLIGKYKEPFDEDFWSTYKGIERAIVELEDKTAWENFKKADGGFKTVNERFFQDENMGGASDMERELAAKHKEAILKEWAYERDIACRNGTNFHKSKEKEWLSAEIHEVAGSMYTTGNPLSSLGEPIELDELPDGIYSELTLWNNFYRVAGQADVIFIETIDGVRYIDVDDYKTNKKIDTTSYKNPRTGQYKKMQRPLQGLMDCNFQHYELQMSLYAYMLECYGYVPRSLNFKYYSNIGTKENPKYEFNRDYPLTYRKKEIIKMLQHYKLK
jgi:hypothetical protein